MNTIILLFTTYLKHVIETNYHELLVINFFIRIIKDNINEHAWIFKDSDISFDQF